MYKFVFNCNYSFRIAANGLNFVALCAGKNPAIIPIKVANTIASKDSHRGIAEIRVLSEKSAIMAGATLFNTKESP